MNRKILIVALMFVLVACKEKKVVETEGYKPTRSDYIVAASHAFVLMCDSAAKQTARAMQDSNSFNVPYAPAVQSRFQLFNSLGKQGLNIAFDNQIRDMLTESLINLHIPCSKLMSIGEKEYPSDFLTRNIMTQKFLSPQLDSLSRIIKRDLDQKYIGSRASSIWSQSNVLYNQYYSTNQDVKFDFTSLAQSSAYLFMNNAKVQEDSVKANYNLWGNKQAYLVMDYLKSH